MFEIRLRRVEGVNGLAMHAGKNGRARPPVCVLLLHGFPELAYSWRKVMPALAEAGYYAPRPTSAATGSPPVGTMISIATSHTG